MARVSPDPVSAICCGGIHIWLVLFSSRITLVRIGMQKNLKLET